MALFPSESEAKNLADTRALCQWVGIESEVWEAFQGKTGPLGDPIRNIALLPSRAVRAAVTDAQVKGANLTFIQKAQVGLVWRIAKRLAAETWATCIDYDPIESDGPTLIPAGAAGAATAGTAATPEGAPAFTSGAKRVKFSQVIDQSDDSEITVAGDKLVQAWYDTWQAFAQGPPEAEEEPTVEQLSALWTRVTLLFKSPWVDFSVFTPFSKRLVKANKFRAFLFQPNGTFLAKEIPGPESFESWVHCWKVFRVACIMLGIVAESALHRYEKHIEKLVKYWPDCWGLIYIAEDKFRAEHLDRIRRRIEGEIARGLKEPPLWNKSLPWSASFLCGIGETEQFWDEHVRHPATAWLAGGRRGIAMSTEESRARESLRTSLPDINAPPALGQEGRGRGKGKGQFSKQDVHKEVRKAVRKFARQNPGSKGGQANSFNSDGYYQRNTNSQNQQKGGKKGKKSGGKGHKYDRTADNKPLCFAWNTNGCVQGPCVNGRVHACTNCRSEHHRACDGKCA